MTIFGLAILLGIVRIAKRRYRHGKPKGPVYGIPVGPYKEVFYYDETLPGEYSIEATVGLTAGASFSRDATREIIPQPGAPGSGYGYEPSASIDVLSMKFSAPYQPIGSTSGGGAPRFGDLHY